MYDMISFSIFPLSSIIYFVNLAGFGFVETNREL
jgi:hypothetical protein